VTYVVSWQRPDGQPGWHPAADAQEAAAFVERLRNGEGAEGARIFRLEEVPYELKPYYKVELAAPASPVVSFAASIAPDPDPPAPDPEPIVDPAPVWAAADVEPVAEVHDDEPVTNGAHARRGLFGR
jgi:hypothetical protein